MKRLGKIMVVLLVASILLSGCFLTDKFSALKSSFNKANRETADTSTPTVIIEPPDTVQVISGETKTVALYFADSTGERLVLEERIVPKVEGIARAAIEELIKGPLRGELKSTVPTSCKLLDINIRPEGLAIVDFSGELVKDLPASAQTEKIAVYSIVNTLTQFPTVSEVELRIDGRKVETLLGHVKWHHSLVRDMDLLR